MTRLTIPVPALTGGVSTQPEPTRLPQHAQRSDNAMGTVIEGLHKRPPTEYLFNVQIQSDGVQHDVHVEEGDFLLHTNGANEFRVWSMVDGAEQIVVNRSGASITAADLSYLNTQTPRESLRFLTLSDYTLVLNRDKVVRESSTLTRSTPNQAMITILQGAYRSHYIIKVSHSGGDNIDVIFETHGSDGSPPGSNAAGTIGIAETSVKTDVIATELASYLWTGTGSAYAIAGGRVSSGSIGLQGTGRWAVDVEGSSLRIWRLDGTDFTVSIEESQGVTSMSLVYKEIQLFSDLPETAPNGMVVEVVGDPDVSKATYWAQFNTHDTSIPLNSWGRGYWEESVAPGIPSGLDPSTMPHALIRQSNGRWRFTPLDGVAYVVSGTSVPLPRWEPRPVGDAVTNPSPDFVSAGIRGLCFHEGRLGLVGPRSLTLSEVREPFSLYRTSVVDVTDSERISLKAPTQKSETISHAVPLGGDIVLFTEETQYLVRSEGPYSPSSVSMVAAGGHDSDPVAEPVQVRGTLFVPREVGGSGAVSVLQVTGDSRPSLESLDLTASVPGYLGVPHRIITTPQLDVVCTYAEGVNVMHVYTQFVNGGEKVHQAWQRFLFGQASAIQHAWFRETVLYLMVAVGGERQVWKMRLQPNVTDAGSPVIYWDQRVDSTSLGQVPVLVSGNTAYTLPFAPSASLLAMATVTRKAMRILSIVGRVVTVAGDRRSTPLTFGYPFEFRHDLSRIYLLDKDRVPVSQGILRLETGTVYYDKSGGFDVVTMDERGGESVLEFGGTYLAQGANYQKVNLSSGKLVFPIRDRAEEVRISFRSSTPEALHLISLDVNAKTSRQGRRGRA